MKETWSLDALYTGYDDPKFEKDKLKLAQLIEEINEMAKQLTHEDELKWIIEILQKQEQLSLCSWQLGSYVSLRQSVDTSDAQTVALLGQLNQTVSEGAAALAKMDAFIQDCDDLDQLIQQSDYLKEYEYLLKETKQDGKYRLTDDVEAVITKLNISAGDAWSNLQEYLTSTLEVSYQDKTITLSEVRNLAYDSDAAVRKAAYEAELKAYEPIKQSVAFALNNIKSQVNTICDLRGFTSPLDMTLYYSRMKRETLDAMMEAITASLPMFHSYLKRKAELLGHKDGLLWYDLFAPLNIAEGASKKYTISQAKDYLITHFSTFASDLVSMIETAFDHEWIDFYPRKGKVGGAFCANLPFIKQSRVLTNFDGELGDIVTLAHEPVHR